MYFLEKFLKIFIYWGAGTHARATGGEQRGESENPSRLYIASLELDMGLDATTMRWPPGQKSRVNGSTDLKTWTIQVCVFRQIFKWEYYLPGIFLMCKNSELEERTKLLRSCQILLHWGSGSLERINWWFWCIFEVVVFGKGQGSKLRMVKYGFRELVM